MKRSFVMLALGFLIVSTNFLYAKDMLLTTLEGEKLVLHEDNTWGSQSGKNIEFDKDFTVPVNNGKVVLIATDGTWGYVEKEIQDETKLVTIDSIVGIGHSINRDVMVATTEAQNQALKTVVAKTKNALKQLDIDAVKLQDCIKRVEKEVNKKEDFKQGKGWDVSIQLVLDRGSILAVAECARKLESDKKPDKKSATKKKS